MIIVSLLGKDPFIPNSFPCWLDSESTLAERRKISQARLVSILSSWVGTLPYFFGKVIYQKGRISNAIQPLKVVTNRVNRYLLRRY